MLKTTLRGSAKIVKPQEILLLYYINVLLAYKILCSKDKKYDFRLFQVGSVVLNLTIKVIACG